MYFSVKKIANFASINHALLQRDKIGYRGEYPMICAIDTMKLYFITLTYI